MLGLVEQEPPPGVLVAPVAEGFEASFIVAAYDLRDPAGGVAGNLGHPLGALAPREQPEDLGVAAFDGVLGLKVAAPSSSMDRCSSSFTVRGIYEAYHEIRYDLLMLAALLHTLVFLSMSKVGCLFYPAPTPP